MNNTEENAVKAGDKSFDSYARSLIAGDRRKLIAAIAELISRGEQNDCEKVAAILAYATVGGDSDGDYYSARYGSSFDKRYLDLFLRLCQEGAIPEREYIKVLLATGSADKRGELYGWTTAADVYLTRRAGENFELVADYIDKYDKKYTKYGVLIRVDSNAALKRLVATVLYGKNVDKTAIRDVLMDHSGLAEPLMALYYKSQAKERAAIARLLLLYINDVTVKAFIDDVVAADKSKTVRDVLPRDKKTAQKTSPIPFFEQTMANGEMYPLSKWRELFKKSGFAAVADRTFFFTSDEFGINVLVYNEGEFLDMTDTPVPLEPTDLIGVLHPADVPNGCDVLSLNISQPFKQISRRTFMPPRGGRTSEVLSGTLIERADFEAAFKKLGFALCGKRSASEKDIALKFCGKYAIGIECDFSASSDTVACGGLLYYLAADVVKLNRTYYVSSASSVPPDSVPKREFSELTLAAYCLFGRE
ncbi:MAG: DUF4132 domain-containing protein [Clostridiales bacterium]|nr:DUF4132 domain-containing protein [Clostridiales bacterium]